MTDQAKMAFPDPLARYPVTTPDGAQIRSTVFLDQVIRQENFEVGAFSYASDFDPPENWAARLAPYLFEGTPDRLTIGRFCQIAHGTRFVTAGANHARDGFSTYPFPIFDPQQIAYYKPDTRPTRIGHDVWFGMNAMVLPGAEIGNGVIVGAGAVVRGKVPDYSVVIGNPGRVFKRRFSDAVVEQLCELAWWHWPDDTIATARTAIINADLEDLRNFCP